MSRVLTVKLLFIAEGYSTPLSLTHCRRKQKHMKSKIKNENQSNQMISVSFQTGVMLIRAGGSTTATAVADFHSPT